LSAQKVAQSNGMFAAATPQKKTTIQFQLAASCGPVANQLILASSTSGMDVTKIDYFPY